MENNTKRDNTPSRCKTKRHNLYETACLFTSCPYIPPHDTAAPDHFYHTDSPCVPSRHLARARHRKIPTEKAMTSPSHPVAAALCGPDEDSPWSFVPDREVHTMNASEEHFEVPELFQPEKRSGGLLKEKPIHRTIAYMLLQGATQRKVSEVVGLGEMTISKLVNTGWFREVTAKLAAVAGGDAVMELLKGASTESAQVLIQLTQSKNENIKLKAAESVLDRVFGKAVTRVQKTSSTVPVDPAEELAELNQEIARSEEQLRTVQRL
jgi:hypothetical protein